MDQKKREQKILNNMGLVYSIAHSFHRKKHNKYLDVNDLIQEGVLGLIKAVDNYDIKQGIKFSTYAFKCIKRVIINFLLRENYHRKHSKSLNTVIGRSDGNKVYLSDVIVDDSFEEKMEKKDYEENLKKEIYSYDYLNKGEKNLLCGLFGIACEEQTSTEYRNIFDITRQGINLKIKALFEKIRNHKDLYNFINHQL